MGVDLTSYAVQMELAGVGGGWTDVSADVLLGEQPLRFRYGITGNGPTDRVASVGICTFVLDNSASNSAAKLGYYSPLHTNVRSGFAFGINVRIVMTYAGTTYYKFRGRLAAIEPRPGKKLARTTLCTVVDWMNEASRAQAGDVALQISKRSDQVFSAVLATITRQPAASSIAAGIDTFTYALDNLSGNATPAVSIFQDISQSELGFVYVKGDTVQGETLVYENRQSRVVTTTNSVSFNDDMVDLVVPRDLSGLINRLDVVLQTRTIDAAATTVLYALPTPQSASIAPAASVTIWGSYRDPAQLAIWVGGTAMVAPVATTDYTFNTLADGTGTDLTASFTVAATYFGSTVKFVLTNNHATLTGFPTKLQCRGKGLYRYNAQTVRSDNSTSQTTYGLRPMTLPMVYQDRQDIGQGAADYLVNLYGNPQQQVTAIAFTANDSATFMTAALAREISDRIGIDETVTGVTAAAGGGALRGWYINSIEFTLDAKPKGPFIRCTWTLSPSTSNAFWILDQVGASNLDVSTILGYI